MKSKKKGEDLCVICKLNQKREGKAKTCDQSCAGKLAWKTRLSQ